MDERCKTAHARLLAGTCPWCGCSIVAGQVQDQPESSEFQTSAKQPMEPTLHDHVVKNGVLSRDEAVAIVEQVASELARFHKSSRLHGSLTPRCIFLTEDGSLILGAPQTIASTITAAASSDDKVLYDAVNYLAPEQALDSLRADHRADIYSLGCILYFMLTGSAPFSAGTISERLLNHQCVQPTPIEDLRDGLPTGLLAICQKMLHKKPEHRHQSTELLLREINSWKQ